MGPLGSVSLIVAAGVVALLVNLTDLTAPSESPGERRALDRQQTSVSPLSPRWRDGEWRGAWDEHRTRPNASFAETLVAVVSGDLLPTVPGDNVVEEVRTLALSGMTARNAGASTVATGGSSRFPGTDDVLHGAPGPGGPSPVGPSPSSPSPSSPSDPSTPAPSDPLPSSPGPSDPTPSDPTPSDPTPSDPPSSGPEPSDPPPSDPPPSDPEPTDPTPSDPPPSDPPPSDPEPTEPTPSDPAP